MVATKQANSPTAGVPSLTRWGVTPHADLVFRALAQFGAQSPSELGRSLHISIGYVRGALDELQALGAVGILRESRKPNDRQWRSSEAGQLLATLRDRQVKLAKARVGLQRQLSFLDVVGVAPEDLRHARPISSRPATVTRYFELMAVQQNEHLVMNPESAFSSSTAKASVPSSQDSLARDVKSLNLGVPASVEDESAPLLDQLTVYDSLEYRELPEQPTKLSVFDRTTAILPLNPGALWMAGVWEINCPTTVAQLVGFYMNHWDRAKRPVPKWMPPAGLSVRERSVLLAMASCPNDAVIGERLHLSERTISYTLKDLMERFGVKNRFQLGLMLGAQSSRIEHQGEV